jgi:serine/threonine-protein kinase
MTPLTVGPVPPRLASFLEQVALLSVLPRGSEVKIALGYGEFPEPDSLTAELERVGWLTAWQGSRAREQGVASLILGQYVLVSQLGEGGMGEVFHARHHLMDRDVALKTVRGQGDLERFRREIRGLSKLAHPNIVTAHDAGEANGVVFLVTELVPGKDLAHLVEEDGPLPLEDLAEVARQAALALGHVHACGMVHRDIKPQNFMASRSAEGGLSVKLLDLGLVRMQAEASSRTREGGVLGTLDYIAPEQAQAAERADIRSDLYSLGCTLYFLLTGKPPFPGGSPMDKVLSHLEREPISLRTLRPDCPAWLAEVVERLMAKQPERRFQTPGDLSLALARLSRGSTLAAASPTRPSGRGRRSLRAMVAAGMAAVALVAAVAAWVAWPRATPGSPPDDPGDGKQGGGPSNHGFRPPEKVGELFRWSARQFDHSSTGLGLCLTNEETLVVNLVEGGVVQRLGPLGWGRISPDGQRIYLVNSKIPFHGRIVRVSDGQEEWDLDKATPALFSGAFSSDGGRLALVVNGQLTCFDLGQRRVISRTARSEEKLTRLAFCLNDRCLITESASRKIQLWDAQSGKEMRQTPGRLVGQIELEWLSPGRNETLIQGGEGGLHLWDIEEWKSRLHLPGQKAAVVSAGGAILSVDIGVITFWDGKGAFLSQKSPKAGNIHGIAISPDGTRALTGHRSGAAYLWGLNEKKPILELRGHDRPVNQAVFLDHRRAVTHSADHQVISWGLP